jgi:Zn-dependent peptidase ImmA (M78 family)/transcriptional regulator with XRE-family HTH domain
MPRKPRKKMQASLAGIQASVLKWARESQGYSFEDVALHLKRGIDEIEAWEAGTSTPTYSQLEELAYGLYKRPLAVFFLPAPPSELKVKQEFRTLPDFALDQLSADTRYQLRLAHAFQISLRELNGGANPATRKVFNDIALSVDSNIPAAAKSLRDYLGISVEARAVWVSVAHALGEWRNTIENVGVFVFKHSFKQKEISGFCLADAEFPVIYLNNSTAKSRQIFSLFHELVHLLLKVNSISLFSDSHIEQLPTKEQRIEKFCNALTAEFLIPSDDLSAQLGYRPRITDELIVQLAGRYYVSREVVLRRILDRGLVTQAVYESKAKQWATDSESEGSGGNYYATQSTYLGERYLRLVFGKHYQGSISLEQVADYLGVRSKSVAGLEALLLRKATPA